MKTLGRQIVPRLCMQRDPDSGSGGSGRLWESSGRLWDIQYVTAVTAPCSNCPLLAAARCFGNQVSSRAGRSGVLPQCPAFPPPCAVAKHDGTEVTQNLGFFACTIGAQSDGRAFVRRCGVDGASTRPTLDVTSDVTTPTLVEPRCILSRQDWHCQCMRMRSFSALFSRASPRRGSNSASASSGPISPRKGRIRMCGPGGAPCAKSPGEKS